jgi:hypothetical protein
MTDLDLLVAVACGAQPRAAEDVLQEAAVCDLPHAHQETYARAH